MSKIRSKGSRMELTMMKALQDAGIGFQYQPRMFGKPDFLVEPRITVFCDSSFWHGRNWRRLKEKLSKDYSYGQIRENHKRDVVVNKALREQGFVVLRFWDSEIDRAVGHCVEKIESAVRSSREGSATEGVKVAA